MTYARQRLWLGISGVGTTVLLSLAAVTFDLPHRLIHPGADQNFSTALAAIALVWMLHAALLLPFDLLGGLVVVRQSPGVLRWISAWLRAVTVQWLWFALASALLLRTSQQFGMTKALLVFLLLQLVLVSRQGLIAWLVGGLDVGMPSDALAQAARQAGLGQVVLREVAADEPSFVGAWTGIDAKQLWVPARWVDELTTEQLTAALARRAAVRALGLRRRGVLLALAWNTAGFAFAASAPRSDLVTAAGFVTTLAWFALWSFLGVLLLPSLSRPAVLAADASAHRAGHGEALGTTIARLDGWQDDESERPAGVEAVFHPVPARSARIRALNALERGDQAVHANGGAWHATRMMLYLSWAGMGGLSRAVHCNIGRPAVWVMLPGD